MKRVFRSRVYLSFLLLSGCGYAFDTETFTFVEAPGTSAGFNFQGWAWPGVTAPTRVGSNGEQDRGTDRSFSTSDEASVDTTSGDSGSSSSQPPSDNVGNDNADNGDASSGGTNPSPANDDDSSSSGNTGPSLPSDDLPNRPSIPGDVGGPGLGGGVDPVGDLPPGGGLSGLF